MPRQETTLSVFVASPGDVQEEREKLQEVIAEINAVRSRETGVRLELLTWETYAYPGFSSDPQNVINQAIPQDWDIFIGVMWQRFGTPTLRAPSGTAEEFRTAKKRYDADPRSVRIMFYFKEQPIPPSKVDAGQISQVQNFRAELGPAGGLHWSFDDSADFERLVRIHLQRAMQDWREGGFPTDAPPKIDSNIALKDDEDLGLIDLAIEFTERLGNAGVKMIESNDLMHTATVSLGDFGNRFTEMSEPNSQYNILKIKKLSAEMAEFFRNLAAGLNDTAGQSAQEIYRGIDAMIKFVELQPEISDEEAEQILVLIQTMDEAQLTTTRYHDTLQETHAGLNRWPSITKELNVEKKRLAKTLDDIISEFGKSIQLMGELKKSLFSLLKNRKRNSS